MIDDDNVIDAEIVEIVENVPAVIDHAAHGAGTPIEATRSQTADGRDWPHGPKPERRCTAHSSRTGDQCKNAAIKGGRVCRYHGGAAPHVMANAKARLQNAADAVSKELIGIALAGDSEAVKLAAIRDLLDRTIGKAPTTVEIGSAKPYETVFDTIGGESSSAPWETNSAGQDTVPPAMVDSTGYDDLIPEYSPRENISSRSSAYEPSDANAPPPRSRRRDSARDRREQAPQRHITGDDAMRMANEVNRQIGALPPLPELESNHRRYPRP
jgi:hypothetical protein